MKNATRHGESTERHWTIRFELTEDLSVNTAADAKRLKFNSDDDDYELSDQIVSVFEVDGVLSAKSGARGRAVWAPEAKRYEIISLETLAAWIEYELHATGGDLVAATTNHLVTVTAFHNGSDPGDEVIVSFEEKWEANEDNVGKAILGNFGNYHNLVIDCLT